MMGTKTNICLFAKSEEVGVEGWIHLITLHFNYDGLARQEEVLLILEEAVEMKIEDFLDLMLESLGTEPHLINNRLDNPTNTKDCFLGIHRNRKETIERIEVLPRVPSELILDLTNQYLYYLKSQIRPFRISIESEEARMKSLQKSKHSNQRVLKFAK
jgi:hypothetical protein